MSNVRYCQKVLEDWSRKDHYGRISQKQFKWDMNMSKTWRAEHKLELAEKERACARARAHTHTHTHTIFWQSIYFVTLKRNTKFKLQWSPSLNTEKKSEKAQTYYSLHGNKHSFIQSCAGPSLRHMGMKFLLIDKIWEHPHFIYIHMGKNPGGKNTIH
jgi:hypothetical protein